MALARSLASIWVLGFLFNVLDAQTPLPTPSQIPTTELICDSSTEWFTGNSTFGSAGGDLPVFSISLASATTGRTGLFISTCDPATNVSSTGVYIYRNVDDLQADEPIISRKSAHEYTDSVCDVSRMEEVYVALEDGDYIVFVESRSASYDGLIQVVVECVDVDLSPAPISCGDSVQGSTIGLPPRTPARSGDALFSYEHTTTHSVSFSTCSSSSNFDTVLELRNGSCEDVETLASDAPVLSSDDACGLQSAIMAENLTLGTYCVVVRGYSYGQEGEYDLSVSCPIDPLLTAITAPAPSSPLPTPAPYFPTSTNSDGCNAFGGIENEDDTNICCPASCGTCDGTAQCELMPGGAQNCCLSEIFAANKQCGEDGVDAPCVLEKATAFIPALEYVYGANEILFDIEVKAPHGISIHDFGFSSIDVFNSEQLGVHVTKDRASSSTPGYTFKPSYWELAGVSPPLTGSGNTRANMSMNLVLGGGATTGVGLQWPLVPRGYWMDISNTFNSNSTSANTVIFENDDIRVLCGVAWRGFYIDTYPNGVPTVTYNRCFFGQIYYSVLDAPTPTVAPSPSPTPMPSPAPNGPSTPFYVTDARFSSYGTQVHIDFSAETNGPMVANGESPSAQNCEDWFTQESLALIAHPKSECAFTSHTRLTIELSHEATLLPAEVDSDGSLHSLRIRSDTSLGRLDNSETGYGGEESFAVGLPRESAPPVARLHVPTRVAPCNSEAVVISAENSQGFAGRPQRAYHWASPDCPSLNLEASTSTPTQTLNFSAVTTETQCRFELTVTNFMGVSSSTVVSDPLVILPREAAETELFLTIQPDGESPWERDETHRLRARVELPECGIDLQARVANADFSYSWRVEDVSAPDETTTDGRDSYGIVDLRERTDQSYLWIHAYELKVGRNYTASLRLTDASGGFPDVSAQFEISIGRSPLSALIAGPEVREALVGSPLQLDAVQLSSDPETRAPDGVLGDDYFEFLWECSYTDFDVTEEGVFVPAETADSAWQVCDSAVFSDSSIVERGVLSLAENTLEVRRAYKFTVTIARDSRAASAEAFIVVRPAEMSPPLVYINIVGSSSSVDRFCTLRLTSGVIADNPVTYQWRELTEDLLEDPDVEPYMRTGLAGPTLALRGRALRRGDRYTFALDVTDTVTGLVGHATTTVRVRRGPRITSFNAAPVGEDATGVELTSLFRLNVDAFFEGESNLQYQFSVRTDDGDEREIALTQLAGLRSVDVRLPAGNHSLIARVSHAEYSAEATTTIAVLPLAMSPGASCDTFETVRDLLENSLTLATDSDAAFQALLVGANLLSPLTTIGDDTRVNDFAGSSLSGCVNDLESFRGFMYQTLARVWSFQSVHSLSQIGQLALILELLSQDTSRFSLQEVTTSLSFIDEILSGASNNQPGGDISAYEGERDEASSFGNSVSDLLSNVLQATSVVELGLSSDEERLGEFCDIVGAVHNDVQMVLRLEVSPLLVGETSIGFIEHNVVGQALRASANTGASLLEIPESDIALTLVSDAESFVDPVTGVDHSAPMPRVTASSVSPTNTVVDVCFAPRAEDAVVASPMVDITVVDCREDSGDACLVGVDNVRFTLEYDEAGEDHGSDLVCSFWDETKLDWSSEGCEKIDEDPENGNVVCQCNHLTTFAIIRSYRRNAAGISSVPGGDKKIFDTPATVAFALLYTVVGTVAFMQSVRMIRYMSVARNDRPTIAQVLVGVSCMCEVMNLMFLYYRVPIAAFEVLSIVRYGIHYAVFALVSQQWAALFHQVMATTTLLRRGVLKYIFLGGASFCALVVAILIILSSTLDPNSKPFENTIHTGSIVVAIFGVLVATVFVVYGVSIIRMVAESSKKTKKKSKSMQRTTQRISRAVLALTVSFAVESTVAVISTALSQEAFEAAFVPLQSFYLLFNLLTLVTVLYLFYSLVAKVSKTWHETRNKSSGSQRSSDRLRANSGESGRTSGNDTSRESANYRQTRDRALSAQEVSMRSTSGGTNSVNEHSAFSNASFVSAGGVGVGVGGGPSFATAGSVGAGQASPPASLARGVGGGDGGDMPVPPLSRMASGRGGGANSSWNMPVGSPPRSPRSISRRDIRSARPTSMRRVHRPMHHRHRRVASGGSGSPTFQPASASPPSTAGGGGWLRNSTPFGSKPNLSASPGDSGTSTPVFRLNAAPLPNGYNGGSGPSTPVFGPSPAALSPAGSGTSTPVLRAHAPTSGSPRRNSQAHQALRMISAAVPSMFKGGDNRGPPPDNAPPPPPPDIATRYGTVAPKSKSGASTPRRPFAASHSYHHASSDHISSLHLPPTGGDRKSTSRSYHSGVSNSSSSEGYDVARVRATSV